MEFKTTRVFARAYKRLKRKYRTLDKEIERLCNELSNNPTAGIPLGSGLFKIRLASSDMTKGKVALFGSSIILCKLLNELSFSIFIQKPNARMFP